MAHEEQDYVDGWQIYSLWIDELRESSDLISQYDEDERFMASLKSCSNNVERFKFIWNNERLRSEIRKSYLRDSCDIAQLQRERMGKSIEESHRLREAGNKSFKDGEYIKACNYYTQAVRFAPFPTADNKHDDCLSLALGNRSAALYALTRYRLCLSDIELAISFGYPEANRFKLMIRKVKCLHVLSIWANDVEDVKTRLSNTMKNPSTKEYVRSEISNMFEFLSTSNPEEMKKDELDVEDESSIRILNSSKSLPKAADCVEMSYDSDKGRYLLLNKDVSFARLLVVETPFACNLAPSKRNEYCYNCFARLHQCGLSCGNCTQVFYCSRDCLNDNAKVHSYECNKLLDFHSILGVAYLVAHIMFKIDFNPTLLPLTNKKTTVTKTLEEILKIDSHEWPDYYYKGDYTSVLSLQDRSDDFDYDSLMGYTLTAAYLTVAFQDNFPTLLPTDEQSVLTIGSIILKHLLQLQTNLISVLDQNLQCMAFIGSTLTGVKESPIGVAIYPTVSLMNHSCSPNIFSMFYKNKFYARAAKGLECGTEINYCYGPSVSRMTKRDRQTRLREQYFFECRCHSCENNIENECNALACQFCDGPVIYSRDKYNKCQKCQREGSVDVVATLDKLTRLEAKLNDLINTGCTNASKFEDIESQLKKLVYWKNRLFVKIKSQLIESAQSNRDSKLALQYSREEVEMSEKSYGENSLESIMTKLKYINLDCNRLRESLHAADESSKVSLVPELNNLATMAQTTRGKLKELLNSTNLIGAEASFDQEIAFLTEVYTSTSRQIDSIEKSKNPEQERDRVGNEEKISDEQSPN